MNIASALADAAFAFSSFSRERPLLYFSLLGAMFLGCVAIRLFHGLARFCVGSFFACACAVCLFFGWRAGQPWFFCAAAMGACPMLLWRNRRERDLTTQEFLMGQEPRDGP